MYGTTVCNTIQCTVYEFIVTKVLGDDLRGKIVNLYFIASRYGLHDVVREVVQEAQSLG